MRQSLSDWPSVGAVGGVDAVLFGLMFFVSIMMNISSIDDAFIDVLAFGIMRHGLPGQGQEVEIPWTAVFVANWHEEDVLGKMVEGNLARIPDPSVMLYLGVYPNDTGTLGSPRSSRPSTPTASM